MADPFIGEIRSFGFSFAPLGWAQCNGQLVAIAQNTALFEVVGTTYGGDGVQTMGLPNMQGLSPMHWGNSPGLNTSIGQVLGQSVVTLTIAQIPQHNHAITSAVIMSGQAAERSPRPTNTSFLSANTSGVGTWQIRR